jgi:hypothetical protein
VQDGAVGHVVSFKCGTAYERAVSARFRPPTASIHTLDSATIH